MPEIAARDCRESKSEPFEAIRITGGIVVKRARMQVVDLRGKQKDAEGTIQTGLCLLAAERAKWAFE